MNKKEEKRLWMFFDKKVFFAVQVFELYANNLVAFELM